MGSQELEVMIQKFNDGDRSLEVLAPLNEAAWDGFHDPWERKPFFLTADAEVFLGDGLPNAPRPCGVHEAPEQDGAGSARPAESRRGLGALAPRLAERIACYLEVQHWDFVQNESGEFRCTPPLAGMVGQDLTLRLSGGGPRSRVLWFHLGSGFQVASEARSSARALCARWNSAHPDYCARLEMQPPFHDRNHPRTGTLSLHSSLPVPPEVTVRTIVAFLDNCMDQAGDFWTQARMGLLP